MEIEDTAWSGKGAEANKEGNGGIIQNEGSKRGRATLVALMCTSQCGHPPCVRFCHNFQSIEVSGTNASLTYKNKDILV